MHIDLPDYGGSECSPATARPTTTDSWESPVLGESVSMYEQQQQEQVDEVEAVQDILSQVKRLLANNPAPDGGQPPAAARIGKTKNGMDGLD
jgi:hypothetical protein